MIVLCRYIQTVMKVPCRYPQKTVAMNTKRGLTWNPAHKYLQMTKIVVSVGQFHENKQEHWHALPLTFNMLGNQWGSTVIYDTLTFRNQARVNNPDEYKNLGTKSFIYSLMYNLDMGRLKDRCNKENI